MSTDPTRRIDVNSSGTRKTIFQTKNFSHQPRTTNSPHKEKVSLYLPEKITNLPPKEKVSVNSWKKQFSKQKVSCTCAKKVKRFISDLL